MSEDREFRERLLVEAIMRSEGVKMVVFEGDGRHLLIGPIREEGEESMRRYQIGTEAQQFLGGEFPVDLIHRLDLTLKAPSQD